MSKAANIVFADSESHADMGRISNAMEILSEFNERSVPDHYSLKSTIKYYEQ